MVVLSSLRGDVGLNVLDILLYAFTDDLLPDHGVEENVELNDDLLEVVLLVGLLLSHKEPILLLEDVLDLADDVRPPDNFPVLLGVY